MLCFIMHVKLEYFYTFNLRMDLSRIFIPNGDLQSAFFSLNTARQELCRISFIATYSS